MSIPGYAGNILHVDLTSRKVRKQELDPELIRAFIGGYGINSKLAYDLIPPDTAPLSPENLIILGVGTFVGTLVPGAARLAITTKFPINGAFGAASVGGSMALMLKSSGYDHVVISGRAGKPVYISILDDNVELHDAAHLWGKDTFETVDELRKSYEPCSILPIGPAGENLVKVSITSIDKLGTAGSGGLPAVMGSKNLKAIVVQMGSKPVRVAHRIILLRLVNSLHDRMMDWPGRKALIGGGSAVSAERVGEERISSNWSEIRPDSLDKEGRIALAQMHRQSRKIVTCPSCPLADKVAIQVKEGRYQGMVTYMTQFASWRRFGGKNAVDEYNLMAKYQDLANRYGLCLHNFNNVLSFVIHLYQKGIITKADTGGMELKEDFDTAIELMKMTTYRQGFGDVLADGVLEAARRIGKDAEKQAVHIKGRCIVYEPRLRGLGTMEFEQITTPRGSHVAAGGSPSASPNRPLEDFVRHGERMGIPEEALKRIVGTSSFNPGRFSRYSEDWYSLFNCLGLCNRAQVNRFYHIKTITELYSAITGTEVAPSEFMRRAERAWNIYKLLNVRAGFSRKDDRAPEVWFTPLKESGLEHSMTDYYRTKTLARQDIEKLLDDYYDERGWDIETGTPTPEKLEELGLGEEASYLKT